MLTNVSHRGFSAFAASFRARRGGTDDEFPPATFFAGAKSRGVRSRSASPRTEWWLRSRPVAPSPEVATAGETATSLARSSRLVAVFFSMAITGLRRAPGFAAVMDTVEADIRIVENRFSIQTPNSKIIKINK